MSGFKDDESVRKTVARISDVVQADAMEFVLGAAEAASHPDRALVNFERWIAATGSPPTMFMSVTSAPELGRLLVALLGASHQIADVLVQNPELASVVLDPESLHQRPDVAKISEHAWRLLSDSGSYRHSLDRVRFLKQTWHLRIAAADLAGLWPEDEVWTGLSKVAEALIATTAQVVWADAHGEECPVKIIAFGKLGGQELNFSSDVDLVYVLDDGADEAMEKKAKRYCERLTRALSDRMGRGSLYRVDLRLRPYSSSGPICPTLASIEGYYNRYAEPWEHLALIRSGPIVADDETRRRWAAMREEVCFRPARGEWVVQDLMKMRERIEGLVGDNDIKRAHGGIRDIEFLVQILQLLYGKESKGLQSLSTCDTIRALEEHGAITQRARDELLTAYTFLRQVEHRIQLLGDLQSHVLPQDEAQRADLARRMGFQSLAPFDSSIAMHRANARRWYESVLRPNGEQSGDDRSIVAEKAGASSGAVLAWLDGLPEHESFYASLLENDTSFDRVVRIAESAPALLPALRQWVSVTEQVLSGEIFEEVDPTARFQKQPKDDSEFASIIRRGWLGIAAQAALSTTDSLGASLSALMEAALRPVFAKTGAGFAAIALGSFGARELGVFSDLDMLFVGEGGKEDEDTAQRLLGSVQALRALGAPLEIDLRLRPEGKKGSLVISEQALATYSNNRMEPWERLALGRSRPLFGYEMPPAVTDAAFGGPLGRDVVESLKHMKRRIETERVPIQFRNRHIKLGAGGQDDVLWAVQLLWWQNYGIVGSGETGTIERARALESAGAINSREREVLVGAWSFYTDLRARLALLGHNDEVLPENPDKLDRLAAVMSLKGPNGVIEAYQGHVARVRPLFVQTMERLNQ